MAADARLLAALAELAAEDLEGLVASARAEARERVRALLTDAITETMLEQVLGMTAPSAPPVIDAAPAPGSTAGAATASATGLYVYAIADAGAELPAELDGIVGAGPPALIRHDQLAAVISVVPLADFDEAPLREHLADMAWLERTARAHQAVLDRVGDHATLIPMRLCSVYRDERGLRQMLTRETDALLEALAHLSGKTEWGVKVFAADAAEPDTAADEAPPESGTEYMRRRWHARDSREAADERRHSACIAIHDRLAGGVSDALTCPPQRPDASGHAGEMLLNGVYLVADGQREHFLATVRALQDEYAPFGLELEPTGPWPAYNFVPGTIGAAW